MAKYAPSQVIFRDADERREVQEFCREHFHRSFSEQCRYMLMKAKREAEAQEKPHES
jgi:hypothetical protein